MAEEDTMVQDMMTMMMVIMMVAVLSQIIPGAAQAAPPVSGNVTVALKNPPADATMWMMLLTDWDITAPIRETSGKDRLGIAEAASYEVPAGAKFPLRIAFIQITKWRDDIVEGTLQVFYGAQSIHPYQFDWDTNTWTGPPDPNYVEAFLGAYGHSYYDVDLEAFTT